MTKERLNRKETYAAGMVIFVSLFYIVSLTGAILQDRSIGSSNIFGLTEWRMVALSGVYLSGGILLFARKNAGWIIGAATLLNVVAVAFTYLVAISQSGGFTILALVPVAFFMLVVMALAFLFRRETRRKLGVSNKSYLLMVGLYLALLFITYML